MDEESLEERMERVKGFSLNQVERMYLLTTSPLELTERKRLHYQGKNRGNSLFPVKAPSWSGDEMWKEQVKVKREIFGKKGGIIQVGGAGPETAPQTEKARKGASDIEPVFYHCFPVALDEELMHSYGLAGIVSLATGPGHDAFVAISNRKPFFGLTLSESHTEHLPATA